MTISHIIGLLLDLATGKSRSCVGHFFSLKCPYRWVNMVLPIATIGIPNWNSMPSSNMNTVFFRRFGSSVSDQRSVTNHICFCNWPHFRNVGSKPYENLAKVSLKSRVNFSEKLTALSRFVRNIKKSEDAWEARFKKSEKRENSFKLSWHISGSVILATSKTALELFTIGF